MRVFATVLYGFHGVAKYLILRVCQRYNRQQLSAKIKNSAPNLGH
jgi:hypothetical protein